MRQIVLSAPDHHADSIPRLSSLRKSKSKKKGAPQGWATPDDVASLVPVTRTDLTVSQPSSIALLEEHAAIAGLDGKLDIFSIGEAKVERSLDVGEPVTDTVWVDTKVILATAKGSVRIFDRGKETATFKAHAGAVTGLALHPGNRILASVGADKSFVLYDLEILQQVSRVYTGSGAFPNTLPYSLDTDTLQP